MFALILAAVLSGERVLAQTTETVVLRGHPQRGLPDRSELGWRWKDSRIYGLLESLEWVRQNRPKV